MAVTSEAITNLRNTTAAINGNVSQDAYTTSSSNSSINSQTFLNLMCMQLQYQDPTNPLDNSEMLAQEAQFASLEQMEALTSTFSTFASSYQANSLMGQYVEVTTTSGDTDYGYVEYVNLNEKDGASVCVNGVLRPISQVTKVYPADVAVTDNINQNTNEIKDKLSSIGEGIANLVNIIGNYINKDQIEDIVDEVIDEVI